MPCTRMQCTHRESPSALPSCSIRSLRRRESRWHPCSEPAGIAWSAMTATRAAFLESLCAYILLSIPFFRPPLPISLLIPHAGRKIYNLQGISPPHKKQPSGSSSKRAANAQCIRLPAAFRGKLLGKSGAQAGRNKTSGSRLPSGNSSPMSAPMLQTSLYP